MKTTIKVEQNVGMPRIFDWCNCFGHNYKGYQRGWAKNKLNPEQHLWFPKFYENEEWDNKMTDNGETIIEKCKNPDKRVAHFETIMAQDTERVTFPHSIDNLGVALYRFKGVFRTDKNASSLENGVIHRRISKQVELLRDYQDK